MKARLMMLFAVALCVSFAPVQAIAGGFTSDSNIGIGIDWLYQRQCDSNEKGFEVKLAQAHANPDVCTNNRTLNLRCDKLTDGGFTEPFESAVALFRMAYENEYVVRVFVKGCDSAGHAKVEAVQVLRKSKVVPTE